MRTGNTSSKKGGERKAGAGLLPEPSTDNGTTQRLDRDRPKRAGPSILVIYTLYINCIVVVSEIPMRAGDSRHVPLDRARSTCTFSKSPDCFLVVVGVGGDQVCALCQRRPEGLLQPLQGAAPSANHHSDPSVCLSDEDQGTHHVLSLPLISSRRHLAARKPAAIL